MGKKRKHKYGTCPECGAELIYYLGLDECCTKDPNHSLMNMPQKEIEYAAHRSLRKQGYRYVRKYSSKEIAKMKKEMCWRPRERRQKGKK